MTLGYRARIQTVVEERVAELAQQAIIHQRLGELLDPIRSWRLAFEDRQLYLLPQVPQELSRALAFANRGSMIAATDFSRAVNRRLGSLGEDG